MIKVSGRGRQALLCGFGALGLLAATTSPPAVAMPQTLDYICTPSWDEGDAIQIDWSSGHTSITVRFPNGAEMIMALENGGKNFRYGEADTEIFGSSQERLTVQQGGEANRVCTIDQ